MNSSDFKNIDEYIAVQSTRAKEQLRAIRTCIGAAAPQAAEAISYGMPTYRLNGKNMMHFAAFTRHIGVYATPDAHSQFDKELAQYKRGKGSVQFPIDEPLPIDLIRRMAELRVQQLSKGER